MDSSLVECYVIVLSGIYRLEKYSLLQIHRKMLLHLDLLDLNLQDKPQQLSCPDLNLHGTKFVTIVFFLEKLSRYGMRINFFYRHVNTS